MPHFITHSPRVRVSPFYAATVADGVVSFSTYNHMLMPTGYGDPVAEYERLTNGVSMWDVAVERQVEIRGPDAARLVQVLAPRKLDLLREGVGWYVPLCDHRGVLINDPVLLKHADDRYWLSIADSDVKLWCQAIAAERGFDVEVFEPDVSPLAIQGPRAEDVVAALLGDEIRAIRHFHFRSMNLDGIPLVVARSGWSKQGGFELYLMDGVRGEALWQRVKTAGAPFDIGPGCPNTVERIESGLLSFGGDTDHQTNPFEVGLGRYVDLDAPDDVIGIEALRRISSEGVARQRLGVFIDSENHLGYDDGYCDVAVDGEVIGRITAQVYSERLKSNIGIGLVSTSVAVGDAVTLVYADGRQLPARLTALPFI